MCHAPESICVAEDCVAGRNGCPCRDGGSCDGALVCDGICGNGTAGSGTSSTVTDAGTTATSTPATTGTTALDSSDGSSSTSSTTRERYVELGHGQAELDVVRTCMAQQCQNKCGTICGA